MIRSELASRVLRILDTNATAYTATDFNDDFNEAIAIRMMQILRFNGFKNISQDQAYTDFVSITGLVEGQSGFNGEFSIPSDLLDIERIEITYDGTNWFIISKENGNLYDVSENRGSEQDQAEIQSKHNTSNPCAMILGGSFFIRPLNNGVTRVNGLKVFYSPRQVDISSDIAPSFEANLHQALIYDCAELEMMSHPEKYSQLKESRIARKKIQVDKEFVSFYRRRFKPNESIKTPNESFK